MKITEVVSNTDKQNLTMNGYEIVDQIEIDKYNIVLTKMPDMMGDMIGANYQLGFSKAGTNFTDYSQHDQKYTHQGEKFPYKKLMSSFNNIKEWVNTYGPLAVSSSELMKIKTYNKLFSRAGFDVNHQSIMGQELLIIQ